MMKFAEMFRPWATRSTVQGKARIAATVVLGFSIVGISYTLSTTSTAVVRAQAATTQSVWDGVFTKEQADRGQASYMKNCARCHSASLGGNDEAPALNGSQFSSDWYSLSAGELFERISKSMPIDNPGTLSRQTNADILAYVLSANGFPAGTKELPARSELLAQIRIEAKK